MEEEGGGFLGTESLRYFICKDNILVTLDVNKKKGMIEARWERLQLLAPARSFAYRSPNTHKNAERRMRPTTRATHLNARSALKATLNRRVDSRRSSRDPPLLIAPKLNQNKIRATKQGNIFRVYLSSALTRR